MKDVTEVNGADGKTLYRQITQIPENLTVHTWAASMQTDWKQFMSICNHSDITEDIM